MQELVLILRSPMKSAESNQRTILSVRSKKRKSFVSITFFPSAASIVKLQSAASIFLRPLFGRGVYPNNFLTVMRFIPEVKYRHAFAAYVKNFQFIPHQKNSRHCSPLDESFAY